MAIIKGKNLLSVENKGLYLYDMIYLSTEIGLTHGGSSTVHIYTQTIHRTTQSTQTIHRTKQITTEQHKYQLI